MISIRVLRSIFLKMMLRGGTKYSGLEGFSEPIRDSKKSSSIFYVTKNNGTSPLALIPQHPKNAHRNDPQYLRRSSEKYNSTSRCKV